MGDYINWVGEKIFVEEIEDYLLVYLGVFDVVVVLIFDEYLGECSCVFVIL